MSATTDPNDLYRRIVATRRQDTEAVDQLARWFVRVRDKALTAGHTHGDEVTDVVNVRRDATGAFLAVLEKAALGIAIDSPIEAYVRRSLGNAQQDRGRGRRARMRAEATATELGVFPGPPPSPERLAELAERGDPHAIYDRAMNKLIISAVATVEPRYQSEREAALRASARVLSGEISPEEELFEVAKAEGVSPDRKLRARLDKRRSRAFEALIETAVSLPPDDPDAQVVHDLKQLILDRQRTRAAVPTPEE